MTVFSDLAALPGAEIYLAARFFPIDKSTELERDINVTNAASLYTESGDTPPNTGFRSVVMRGWETERRISKRGSIGGASIYTKGSLIIDNSKGDLSDWQSLRWNNRPMELRMGGRIRADGTAYPYSDFELTFEGLSEDIIPGDDATLEILVVGQKRSLDDLVISSIYRAFGGGVELAPTEKMTTPDDAALNVSSVTMEWIGVVNSLPGGNPPFFRRGGGSNYNLTLANTGYIRFISSGGTLTSTYQVTLGQPLYCAATVELQPGVGYAVKVYAGQTASDITLVGEDLFASFAMASGGLFFNILAGAAFSRVDWEARLWNVARTYDELVANADGPLSDPANQTGLIECWKFGDGVGLTALGSKGLLDLTLDAGIDFVSTLEGDDPEQFGGTLHGKTKPYGYGLVSNVPLTPVDLQRAIQQWSSGASGDLLRLYSRGIPMVPDESIVAVGGSDIDIDATDSTLNFSVPFGLDGHRWVPGQRSPYVPGQRVEITGSVSNDGVYRIATEGVLDDGRTVILIESETVGDADDEVLATLTTESVPASTVAESYAADVQYTYDLATSTIDTPTSSGVEFTADVIGWLAGGGTAKLSEIFEEVAGETVDKTQLTFDPELGIHIATGEEIRRRDLLDAIADSGMAWWIESRTGGFELGTYAMPTGAHAAVITGSLAHTLSETSDVTGRIIEIDSIPSATPAWRILVSYDRVWKEQSGDALAGAVSAARRLRLEEGLRIIPGTINTVLTDWENSEPLGPLETYITNRTDAEIFLAIAQSMFSVKLRWFDAIVSGLGTLRLNVNAVVWLQHPEAGLGLSDGKLARVTGIEEDSSSDKIILEMFCADG